MLKRVHFEQMTGASSNVPSCEPTLVRPSAGMRVPFGFSTENGRLYAPREVPLGKACGCICPGCKQPLFAKHAPSGKVTPHFAHAPGSECANGLETAVHLAAKQLIESERELFVPKLEAILEHHDALGNTHSRRQLLGDGGRTPLTAVRVEESYGDFRPDLIAVPVGGLEICVEVAVTHFVDDAKLARIKAAGTPALEFDLRQYRDFTWDSLRNALVEGGAKVRWLFHPSVAELRRGWMEELQPVLEAARLQRAQDVERERQEQEEERRRLRKQQAEWRAQERRREVEERARRREFMERAARFKAHTEAAKAHLVARGFVRDSLPTALRARVPGEGSFGVRNPLVWQAALFGKLIHNAVSRENWNVSKDYAGSWLGHHFDIQPQFPEAEKIAVWKYLMHLHDAGALRKGRRGRFEIMVVNLSAFEALQAFRNGRVSAEQGLRWVEEEAWPSADVTEPVALAHSSWDSLIGPWAVVSRMFPEVSHYPPVEVVERFARNLDARHLVEYWVSAGYLVLDAPAPARD